MDAMTVKAVANGVRQTPRKVGLVAGLVRGRTVADAEAILAHTPKRAAKPVAKVIASAKANAVNNHGLLADSLVISQLQVVSGPRLKRFKPVYRGMAHPFLKRSSHITVELSGTVKPKKPAAEKPATKKESK